MSRSERSASDARVDAGPSLTQNSRAPTTSPSLSRAIMPPSRTSSGRIQLSHASVTGVSESESATAALKSHTASAWRKAIVWRACAGACTRSMNEFSLA